MTYYEAHRETCKAKAKAYRKQHGNEYRLKQKAWWDAHPDYHKTWRKANRDKVNQWARSPAQFERRQRNRLQKKYGLTLEQFNKIFAAQNHRCAICGTKDFQGRWKAPAVDHCHNGGHVRGILCSDCNRMIGLAHHSMEIMAAALRYLSKELLFNVR